ncbi:30S ribosomal protein S12 methylthiotransferase RimO [Parabacteroides sp. PF5-9]|uniref:30S ribosomal protein S12 methylthiotransferase RimO n=1 Tax=Parabacteroides sp. PF5-9 TaxID=1742404 RepID=UPI0024736091|nr:30S ribosomal protein S12 methylthiotransferase RimO [Parabacteroides sp. PF5-9]MDH6358297.1 ribosomal protein S12 methylthiotransferase [Parabacteroides sp. PF5-9]
MKKNKIDIITLGCSKNLVDSEQLMKQFIANGYQIEHDPPIIDGEIVVVNTCGFIGDAQEESINMILELGAAKKSGKIARLFVMGCLSERFMKDLTQELPEVDKFYGKFNWKEMLNDLGKSYNQDLAVDRILTTPSHYAYLKIAEGCNRTCSYCAIPLITGRYQSRPIEELIEEAKILVKKGVKEFQLIAQDLTYYGLDRYKRLALPELVERLSDVPGVEWIRLHYGYPAQFPYELLRVMRERENVCKYMDIALQHISDPMLQLMRRRIKKEETYELIEQIRKEVPGIHLRTTVMTGHPGETEQDFVELVEFVKKVKFERLGAFIYSHEQGTYSHKHYIDDIPQEIKQERLDYIMRIQEGISDEISHNKIGQTYKTIVDREEEDFYIGRTEFDSPEVDPEVLIRKDKQLTFGDFYSVRITDAQPFELYGEILI